MMNDNDIILYSVHGVVICKNYMEKIYHHCRNKLQTNDDLIKLYHFFRLPTINVRSYKRDVIEEKLSCSINRIARRGDIKIIKCELKKCRRRLFFMDKVNMICYGINKAMCTSIKYTDDDYKCLLSSKDWKKMLINACYLVLLNRIYFENIEDDIQFLYKDDYIFANALRSIQQEFKLPISLEDGNKTLKKAFQLLEDAIYNFGAIKCWSYFIKDLHQNYSHTEKRIRCNSDINYHFPVLYHLIIKALSFRHHPKSINPLVDWDYIKKIATCIVDITDKRDSSHLRFLFPLSYDDYLKALVNHSGVYDLHQYNVNGVIYLVEGIIDEYKSLLSEKMGLSSTEMKDSIRYYLEIANQLLINGRLIVFQGSLLNKEQKTFLNQMATNKPINESFALPNDWGNVDDDSSWIINVEDDFYFLPPVTSVWGIYDKIGEYLNFPSDFGLIVEKRVAEMFDAYLQLKMHSGLFLLDGKKFECDGVIIEDDYAIIIECKSKSLTRKARSGDTTKILDDIAVAYLYSQAQAYRVERALKIANGYFEIYPHESNASIQTIGQSLENCTRLDVSNVKKYLRITCACGNFWILSEPGVISKIEKEFSSKRVQHQKEVDAFFDERHKLLGLYRNDHERKIAEMNRLFLSFDKLWEIISSTTRTNVFKVLWRFSRIVSKQHDTMNHIEFLKNL